MAEQQDKAPNFAKNQDFADEVRTSLMTTFHQLKTNRTYLEEQWLEYFDMWRVPSNGDIDEGRNYKGRANLNIPQVRKEIETMSRRLVKGIFPEDYLKGEASRIENEDQTIASTQIVRHFYDNIVHLRQRLVPWVKQGVIYGTSPARQYWKKETNYQYYNKRKFKSEGGILIPYRELVHEEVTLYDAPVVETCDLFQTYVYPETAATPEDIEIVFFKTRVTEEFLRQKEAQGCAVLPDKETFANLGTNKNKEEEKTQRRLSSIGTSADANAAPGTKYYEILEAWCKLEIEVMVKGKKVRRMTPCVVEILNGSYCIRIQQNPFWHQQAPFQSMRYITPLPGRFYGHGLPESVIALQNQLNDVINQSMDATTMALNPITVVNPAFAPNVDSFEVETGAIWWADPSAVKQFSFPDLSQTGLNNAQMLKSMISEMSDNTPQLPDPISGKARSTGQAEMAVNEWQTDLFNFIANISSEALQTMAKQTHCLLQQYLPDDAVYRIAGKYAGQWIDRVVTPDDIAGNLDFTWIGRFGIENRTMKAQQMLQLLKIMPSIPPDSGIKINWQNFMIKLMRDGYDIQDVENVIETDFLKASTSPYIENKIIEMNGSVATHTSDDDQLHIQWHDKMLNDTKFAKEIYIKAVLGQHIADHKKQAADKQQMMVQAQQMAMQMQMQQQGHPPGGPQAQGGPQGPGGPPPQGPPGGAPKGNRNNPMGNQTQINESASPENIRRGMRG